MQPPFPPDRNLLSFTRTAHTDAPAPLQPRSKGRTSLQRHVPLFPSPSFIVPLANVPRSAESPNLYLRPQVSHKRPDPASPFYS
ncbi:hypothetical protein K438DRAFT_1838007 [Mycena galopus ATCC 62051]|nr:hypothetical protein K438DRAFT_1838007 [Mycena galopus ATCC 62051]